MRKQQKVFSKFEIKAIRYCGVFDNNEGTVIDEDYFFLISGTHILPREEIEHVYMNGMKFYLKNKNGKDLIVEVGKRNGKTDRN